MAMANTFDAYHSLARHSARGSAAEPLGCRLLGISLFEKLPEVIESAADQRMVSLAVLPNRPKRR